ncbi:unnamed protein product [marine sediment metagenome]|uniref:Uncharacterized protein n=1 Tax=marine sediment metagenome TaxID=412755 RepID=X0T2S4_9ZZZZ
MNKVAILAAVLALVSADVAMAKTPSSELRQGKILTFENARTMHAKDKIEGPSPTF